MKIIQGKKAWTSSYEKLEESLGDTETLFELMEMGEATIPEAEEAFQHALKQIEALDFTNMLYLDNQKLQ